MTSLKDLIRIPRLSMQLFFSNWTLTSAHKTSKLQWVSPFGKMYTLWWIYSPCPKYTRTSQQWSLWRRMQAPRRLLCVYCRTQLLNVYTAVEAPEFGPSFQWETGQLTLRSLIVWIVDGELAKPLNDNISGTETTSTPHFLGFPCVIVLDVVYTQQK